MINKEVQNWVASAEYDLETADHMYKSGRFIYVIFMCHLSLEKMLKAHIALIGEVPAKTHDLIYLLKKSKITNMSESFIDFLGQLSNSSIPTRYPEDIQLAIKDYPEPIAKSYLTKCMEVMGWLKVQLKLLP